MIRLYCEHEDEAAVQRILDEAHARLVAFAAARGATSPNRPSSTRSPARAEGVTPDEAPSRTASRRGIA